MDIRFSKEAFIKLEGETVYLKKLSKELLDDYYLALESTSVDTDIYTGTTHKYVKSQIENYIQRNEVDKSRIDFIIFSKEDDKMVGEVIISNADPVSRNAGLRIAIFNYLDFNKGYGSEGLVLSMGYGFGMMNLHRIEMEVMTTMNGGFMSMNVSDSRRKGSEEKQDFSITDIMT